MGQPRYFVKHLTEDNDGTTMNANGNYATVASDFYVQPAAGESWLVYILRFNIEDTSGFTMDEYGNLGAALANGIEVLMNQDGTEVSLTPLHKISKNSDWAHYTDRVEVLDFGAGPTNEHLSGAWHFCVPIRLQGNGQDKLIVRLNDNLTGLLLHHFVACGSLETTED